MHLSTLRSVGGSVMFAIPKSLLEGLGLAANSRVGLSVSEGRLIVEPNPRLRHTLAELIAECDPAAPLTAEEQAWLADQPTGREAL
ncbi:antitoxin [Singulisphaera sp. PoT]|uniref:AbrB/MazE/SpoVT family DNA-binding domain-containing protein n=1 Tax=Singulisphaera sp. PoT TaxID=3411797 RepID=UPI003BF60DE0